MKNEFVKNYSNEFQAFALSKIFENSDNSTHIHLFSREGELNQFSENIKLSSFYKYFICFEFDKLFIIKICFS